MSFFFTYAIPALFAYTVFVLLISIRDGKRLKERCQKLKDNELSAIEKDMLLLKVVKITEFQQIHLIIVSLLIVFFIYGVSGLLMQEAKDLSDMWEAFTIQHGDPRQYQKGP